MAGKQPPKESAKGAVRGETVGRVRIGKAAKGSAGSGSDSGKEMVIGCNDPWTCESCNCGYGSSIDDQSTPMRTEGSGKVRMETGMDTGKREWEDYAAPGTEPAGSVFDEGAGKCSGESRCNDGMSGRCAACGTHWTTCERVTESYWDGRRDAAYYTEQDRKAKSRSGTVICAAFTAGLAIGAILLAIAQRI